VPILTISEQMAAEQMKALAEVRRTRDSRTVMQKLSDLKTACAGGANVMPPLVEAVKAYATVGEISDVMREVFATYEEPAVF
jgi:methylmalonyl-CoA mutase N-terminal domain/subunit